MSAPTPLSTAEIERLDATLLPAFERHHLRLLAHALRTLQQVQRHINSPYLPEPAAITQWLLEQPGLIQDPDFCERLALQLHGAGRQLEALATQHGVTPLELELEALINWARDQADRRLATEAPTTPPEPPAAPPAGR
ncbi:MAG: hypothetical protein KGO47_06120 [Cyanobacteria bacterium REEB417]|nr:hypothetical protein [Cyanobacteria bacterium REEB417]